MADQIIRIKSSRQGYRRGGQVFSHDWLEIDTADLSAAQKRALLADPVLSIEGREEDGPWSPLPAEIREGLASLLQGLDETSELVPFAGITLDLAALDQLKAKADRYDTLLAQLSLHQPDLEGLKLWPVEQVDNLVVALIEGLGEAEGVIDARDREAVELKSIASLVSVIEPHEATLVDLGIPLVPLREVVPRLIAAVIEARAKLAEQNNPQRVREGGGASDGAGPAGGEDSRQEEPARAADASSPADDPAVEPAPKPKPAATPKPTAKGGKASGASKPE